MSETHSIPMRKAKPVQSKNIRDRLFDAYARCDQLEAELARLRARESEWVDCLEELGSAGVRIMHLAAGAAVPLGNVRFECQDGQVFTEGHAQQLIRGLLKKAK